MGDDKPVMRIVHHFACTGGSLISKCISALPNVFLLSEVHPYSNIHLSESKVRYLPSDIISLAKQAGVMEIKELSDKIIIDSITSVNEHVSRYGGDLVLREHSHSDFCIGALNDDPRASLVDLMKDNFKIKSVVTIRNPIDSYLSLKANGWKHFSPFSFDEYCRRCLLFIEVYNGVEVIRYEDFICKPEKTMRKLSNILSLSYDESFVDKFSRFNVSGDSGRSSNKISKRERRNLSEIEAEKISKSVFFKKLTSLEYFKGYSL